MSQHEVRLSFNGLGLALDKFICTAPVTADCHRWPTCDCESWSDEVRDDLGLLIGHRGNTYTDDGEEVEDVHSHHEDPECIYAAWVESSEGIEEDLDGLEVTVPVKLKWEGDFYRLEALAEAS